MWELNYKESWTPKNWCFWTVVLEKTFESPLDCKEIQLVNAKGNQSWIFIGRTDAEAETPILWPPYGKNGLIGKDPDAGKDWRQEEKGTIEDEMVVWHHQLDGHEFEYALGVGDGQGSLVCCSPWGHKESDMPEQLNNNRNSTYLWECVVWRHHPSYMELELAWKWDELLLQKQTPCKCLTWIKTWYSSCRFCHWLSGILVRAGSTQSQESIAQLQKREGW